MNLLLNRPGLAAIVFAAVMLVPGPFLLDLQVDNAPESYFPETAPAVLFNEAIREYFPEDQVLVALFRGADVYSKAFLTTLEMLSDELEQDESIERVIAVTRVDHIQPTSDGFSVGTLLGPSQLQDSIHENRQHALEDRFAPGALVSADGSSLALIVRPAPLSSSFQRVALYDHVKEGIEASGLSHSLVALGGHIALDVAQLKAMVRDLATLIPGTLGVSMLLLWWLFRNWLVLGASALCIGAVNGIATAILVATGSPFTLITAIMPPLLTALTVAMLMHLFNALCVLDARGVYGESRMRDALDAVRTPIVFTALTTACGLLSLMASPIRPISSFGLVSALSVVGGALLIVCVLPALLLKFDQARWSSRSAGLGRLDSFTSTLLRLSLRRPAVVLLAALAVLLGGATQIPRIEVETDLYSFFREGHPLSQATKQIEDSLSGVMPLEVILEGPGIDSFKDPERIEALADLERWLKARPEVDYTVSLAGLISEMHKAFNPELESPDALPDSSALIEQYLLFYDGNDLFDVVDVDFRISRILANLNVYGAKELNKLLADLDERMANDGRAGDKQFGTAGMGRLFADQERLLIRGQVASLYVVSLMITLLMLFLWRNARFTLASIVPNFAPVVLIFALMGGFGIWLDMATAMVASVAIGIAIDDTIHLLHSIKTRLDGGASLTAAIARSVRHRGRALVGTTLVLSAQFLLMVISPFQPTAIFGLLTAFGLVIALFFDLLVLPSLALVLLRNYKVP